MNEQTNDRNEWNDGWMKQWMNEWMNEWTNEWMNERTNERTNEWMNEWMNKWMNEWMNKILNDLRSLLFLVLWANFSTLAVYLLQKSHGMSSPWITAMSNTPFRSAGPPFVNHLHLVHVSINRAFVNVVSNLEIECNSFLANTGLWLTR